MTVQIPHTDRKSSKTMNSEQLNQIIEAILDGKYSWACVLLLRFAGYNPLHYIPYRTYNRLTKQNCQFGRCNQKAPDKMNGNGQGTTSQLRQKHSSKIRDLDYLESVGENQAGVRGGQSKRSWPWRSGMLDVFPLGVGQSDYQKTLLSNYE
jgi:hypothetical protein